MAGNQQPNGANAQGGQYQDTLTSELAASRTVCDAHLPSDDNEADARVHRLLSQQRHAPAELAGHLRPQRCVHSRRRWRSRAPSTTLIRPFRWSHGVELHCASLRPAAGAGAVLVRRTVRQQRKRRCGASRFATIGTTPSYGGGGGRAATTTAASAAKSTTATSTAAAAGPTASSTATAAVPAGAEPAGTAAVGPIIAARSVLWSHWQLNEDGTDGNGKIEQWQRWNGMGWDGSNPEESVNRTGSWACMIIRPKATHGKTSTVSERMENGISVVSLTALVRFRVCK